MEALKALAAAGGNVVFHGALPDKQPGYADGAYAAQDARVAALAAEMTAAGGVAARTEDDAQLAAALAGLVRPKITYQANANARMNRRALETGGELAYLRNTSATASSWLTLEVDPSLPNAYWLDPATGKAHAAEREKAYSAEGEPTCYRVLLPPSGAIILLAEPAGAELPAQGVDSAASPLSIDQYVIRTMEGDPGGIGTGEGGPVIQKTEIGGFTLTVTADNIGSYAPGAAQTKTYAEAAAAGGAGGTGPVLGDWADAGHWLHGDLAYVSAPGTYRAQVEAGAQPAAGTRYVLDLGEVSAAATVRVNGAEAGRLYSAPWRIDVTGLVRPGANEVEIEVQPLGQNRRAGLRLAYLDTGDARWRPYYSHVSAGAAPMAAGLTGPVTLLEVAPASPAISNVRVEGVTVDGFTVVFTATGTGGVAWAPVGAFTVDGWADDAVWAAAQPTGKKDEYSVAVKASDHGGARGPYQAIVWAYDANGASAYAWAAEVTLPSPEPPAISGVKVTDATADGFRVTFTAVDADGVAWVPVGAFTVVGWADDVAWVDAAPTGNPDEYSAYVRASDHGGAKGPYQAIIWAYDATGIASFAWSPQATLP
jgi:hypothetical protein